MTVQSDNLLLSDGFDGRDEAKWRAAIEKVLKGGDFEKRLVSRTADGIALQPLYMQAADKAPIATPHDGRPWQIAQRVDHPDAEAANRFALDDLENGASSLVLVSHDSPTARGFGTDLTDRATLATILEGIAPEMITLRVEAGAAALDAARTLAALLADRGDQPSAVSVNFGIAPLTDLMARGILASDWSSTASVVAATVGDLTAKGFNGPFISVDVRPVSEAGGSEAQELSVALAAAVAYLRALEAAGMDLAKAAAALSFVVPVDAGQFEGIAKLRALRKLWGRVRQASSLPLNPFEIHAETAWRMATQRDPAVNMLRTTMATFTAGIAGADSLAVLPYTLALGLPNGFARRIARNTQSVLLEESNL
ncbi:MAG: methylmalonyl-CoA mutase, partial [Alphaproteobacteria bacterium]|nr:methylmalonyl-CoA mutase [Alphaproteobacteria bacterium]